MSDTYEIKKAIVRIKVVGIGGGGNSVLLRLAEAAIPGIELVAVNTDAKHLARMNAAGISTIQIGDRITNGLGTGGDVQKGIQAAESAEDDIVESLRGADLVFVTAGMGGGVGTGAAPVVAKIIKKLGMLSIGVVTSPFSFEGKRKLHTAQSGIQSMQSEMDALIVVENDNLMKLPENRHLTMVNAFKAADGVLRQAILCISELILTTGVVNVDFADVTTIFRLSPSSDAILGIGESERGSATEAVELALSSPLVGRDLTGARGIILNISGNERLSLFEVSEATNYVYEHTHPDVTLIFGTVVDKTLGDSVRATIVATDFADSVVIRAPRILNAKQAVAGRRAAPKPPASVQNAAQPPAEPESAPEPQAPMIPDFLTAKNPDPFRFQPESNDDLSLPPSFRK